MGLPLFVGDSGIVDSSIANSGIVNSISCSSNIISDIVETLPPDELFMNCFEQKVKDTIKQFNLISENDKVIVAVSGGKDSMVLLYVLHKLGYPVEAFTVDVHIGCYTAKNLENVKIFCNQLGVKLHAFAFRDEYGDSAQNLRDDLWLKGYEYTTCTVCGVLRRKIFNRISRDCGATKMATGHNMDDEVQSVFMNWLKNRQSLNARIGPVVDSCADTDLVPRIKPLFFIAEKDIAKYSKMRGFPVQYSQCPCGIASGRFSVEELFKQVEVVAPNFRENVLNLLLRIKPFLVANQNSVVKKLRATLRCSSCGEPSVSGVCRPCQLIAQLHV